MEGVLTESRDTAQLATHPARAAQPPVVFGALQRTPAWDAAEPAERNRKKRRIDLLFFLEEPTMDIDWDGSELCIPMEDCSTPRKASAAAEHHIADRAEHTRQN